MNKYALISKDYFMIKEIFEVEKETKDTIWVINAKYPEYNGQRRKENSYEICVPINQAKEKIIELINIGIHSLEKERDLIDEKILKLKGRKTTLLTAGEKNE